MNRRLLPLGERVQKAVLAHIRHTYTPYDALLNRGLKTRDQARDFLWPAIERTLKMWRGEGKMHELVMETAFREVVYILDDYEMKEKPVKLPMPEDFNPEDVILKQLAMQPKPAPAMAFYDTSVSEGEMSGYEIHDDEDEEMEDGEIAEEY